MNIKHLIMMLIVAFAAVACSSDDDRNNPKQKLVELSGEYVGSLIFGVGGSSSVIDDAKFIVKANNDGTCSITTPGRVSKVIAELMTRFPGMVARSFTINDLDVDEEGHITYAQDEIKIPLGSGDDKIVYKISKIKGTLINNQLILEYDMQPGAMPMAISYRFNGSKQ